MNLNSSNKTAAFLSCISIRIFNIFSYEFINSLSFFISSLQFKNALIINLSTINLNLCMFVEKFILLLLYSYSKQEFTDINISGKSLSILKYKSFL